MAKSFHDIIKDGRIEVTHQGEEVTLELPAIFKELQGGLMDKEQLLFWMESNDVEMGVIHAGIQKLIIDLRAKARPSTDTKTGRSDSIVAGKDDAQARVDGFEIKPTLPPGSSTPKAFGKGVEQALRMSIEALQAVGMTDEVIKDTLGAKFDRAQVTFVLELIRNNA